MQLGPVSQSHVRKQKSIYGFLLLIIFVIGCTARTDVISSASIETGELYKVFYATNRVSDNGLFNQSRSLDTSFGFATISVPKFHKYGSVEYPGNTPDPARDFLITRNQQMNASAFAHEVRSETANNSGDKKHAVIFVHGYNNTFAESLFVNTQLLHDTQKNYLPIVFSWPSSGSNIGYLHDRNSVLFSRTAFEELLDKVQNLNITDFTIVGHSIGSELIMETLRQAAIRHNGGLWSKLRKVILIAPDIDVEIFQQQMRDIGEMRAPLVIMSSDEDRMLGVSSVLNGSLLRVGMAETADVIPAKNVIFISTSAWNKVLSTNHVTAFRSPEMLNYLAKLLP